MKTQLLVVFFFLSAFLDLALISPFTNKTHIPFFFLGLILAVSLYFFYLARTFVIRLQRRKIKLKISPVIIPISLYATIRLFFLDVIPRWDGSQYFSSLLNTISIFDFSLASFLANFNLFEHPSMGYTFITSIPLLTSPTNLLSLNLTTSALGILAIYSFYKICSYFFNREDKFEITLLTTLFAFQPAFVGVSTTYGPDFGVLVFFLATISTFLYNQITLFLFFSIILVFTKETGAYAYGLFSIAYLWLVEFKFWLKSRQFHRPTVLMLFSPLVLVFTYFLYRSFFFKSVFWGPENGLVTWGEDCAFCFGIKPFNILQNLAVIFILNFNWLLSLLITISLLKNEIIYPLKYQFIESDLKKDLLRVLNFVLTGFVIFFMFYIVYVMPRYTLISIPLLTLFFYLALRNLIHHHLMRRLILCLLIILFFIQIFFTIDPVSKKLFGTYQFGKHQMLKIGTEYLSDGLVYNTQYIYIQRLLDRFINEFNISPKDNIFIEPYAWGTYKTGWGHFIEALPKIYFSLNEPEKLPNRLYYLSFPLMQRDGREDREIEDAYVAPLEDPAWVLEQLTKIYQIQTREKYELNGYSVDVYQLLKHEYN